MILLAHNSYSRVHIVRFTYVFKIFLSRIYPIHHSPSSPLTPFLEQFQHVSFFYFHIWIQNTSTTYTLTPPFLVPTFLPLVSTPRKDFSPLLYIFKIKCIVIVKGSLALVLQVCIYHDFIKFLPPLHYLLILHHHAPLIFNSLLHSALYYIQI
jgi:hypothetical protein